MRIGRIIMATQEIIRKMQYYGDSFFIGLPREWVKKNKLTKGDGLLLRYNGIVVITPTVENIRVEVKKDGIWFFEGEKSIGMTKGVVKRLVDSYGILRATELIKEGIEKRGFHSAVFFDKIERAVTELMLEFVK